MIEVDRTIAVNDPDAADAPVLSAADVWAGLVMKAENPAAFIAAATTCTVVERYPDGLMREVVLRGELTRERVTFEPPHRVIFTRQPGSGSGTIVNEIVARPGGALELRFSFRLVLPGVAEGSAAETAAAEALSQSYMAAVDSTLAAVRRLKQGGGLADGAGI